MPAREPSRPNPDAHFGRAKSCILLFLYGSPSQLELADMKPDAPVEVRGELKGIKSTLPGCDVCELLPHTSRVMHNVTVVRSVTHKYPIHGVAYATTAVPEIDVAMELAPHDARHWPFIGSTVAHLEQRKNPASARKPVPDNIALPFPFSSQRTGEVHRAGPYPAFLGNQFAPHFTSFHGKANRKITKTLAPNTKEFDEPYVGIDPDAYFALGGEPAADLTLDRVNSRKSLLDQMEDARRARDRIDTARPVPRDGVLAHRFEEGAAGARRAPRTGKGSRQLRPHALRPELPRGPAVGRGRQQVRHRLLGRVRPRRLRLGHALGTLPADAERTHARLRPRLLRPHLRPRSTRDARRDAGAGAERTRPHAEAIEWQGGGRDHWSQAYTVLLAGGGIARGKVVGKTDIIGGTVADRPVSPKDLLATAYHSWATTSKPP